MATRLRTPTRIQALLDCRFHDWIEMASAGLEPDLHQKRASFVSLLLLSPFLFLLLVICAIVCVDHSVYFYHDFGARFPDFHTSLGCLSGNIRCASFLSCLDGLVFGCCLDKHSSKDSYPVHCSSCLQLPIPGHFLHSTTISRAVC
jgi:hypothetical protein